MDKQTLYQVLENLGFDCRRNPRYTVQMLTQIKNELEMRNHEINEQLIELVNEQKLKKRAENTIIIQENKIKEQDIKLKKLYDSLDQKDQACILYRKSLKDRDNALNELKVCHDKTHKKNNETQLKNEQLEFELKELRNEYRNHRKKKRRRINYRHHRPIVVQTKYSYMVRLGSCLYFFIKLLQTIFKDIFLPLSKVFGFSCITISHHFSCITSRNSSEILS